MRDILRAANERQVGLTALQRAEAGLTSGGRGPFQVAPGETKQMFQCAGSTSYGCQHTISFDVEDVGSAPDPAIARSPLVAIIEFGNDGTQGRFEVDVKRGTCISVPFGTVNVSIRNEGITRGEAEPVTRSVSAFVDKYPFVRRFTATRTLDVPALAPAEDVPANQSPPIRIPRYATDLSWLRGFIGGVFLVDVYWLDDGGNVLAVSTVVDWPGQGIPVPNGAEYFSIVNGNGFAFDPSLAVFQLSF